MACDYYKGIYRVQQKSNVQAHPCLPISGTRPIFRKRRRKYSAIRWGPFLVRFLDRVEIVGGSRGCMCKISNGQEGLVRCPWKYLYRTTGLEFCLKKCLGMQPILKDIQGASEVKLSSPSLFAFLRNAVDFSEMANNMLNQFEEGLFWLNFWTEWGLWGLYL